VIYGPVDEPWGVRRFFVRVSRSERAAARAERRAEQPLRAERDNAETHDRRAAATEAERRRYDGYKTYRGERTAGPKARRAASRAQAHRRCVGRLTPGTAIRLAATSCR
jgi:hypothetical protein